MAWVGRSSWRVAGDSHACALPEPKLLVQLSPLRLWGIWALLTEQAAGPLLLLDSGSVNSHLPGDFLPGPRSDS